MHINTINDLSQKCMFVLLCLVTYPIKKQNKTKHRNYSDTKIDALLSFSDLNASHTKTVHY